MKVRVDTSRRKGHILCAMIIGGGFDTTTALTAHALEWLSEHPDERARLSREQDALLNPATEEFLRFFTPAPGDGRTISDDMQFEGAALKAGERLWLSWAMANRDPNLFDDPDQVIFDRKVNRHFSFGLGVHRCAGSNVARTVFKAMLTAVLDRLPTTEVIPTAPCITTASASSRECATCQRLSLREALRAQAWTKRWTNYSESVTSRDSPGRSPNTKRRHKSPTDRVAHFCLGRVPLP